MTEYSQSGMRGYGPFPEGAEPTAPTGAQPPSEPDIPQQAARPADDPHPAQPGGAPPSPPASAGHPAPGVPQSQAAPTPPPPTGAEGDPRPVSDAPGPADGPRWVSDARYPADGPPPSSGAPHVGGDPRWQGGAPHPAGGPHPSSGAPHPAGSLHPSSGAPYSAGASYPTSGASYPTSGASYPTSGASYPTSGAPHPTSGAPHPTSGQPHPAAPSSPPHATPTSGPAAAGYGPFQSAADPFGGSHEGWTDTPYGFAAPPGRRIEPSPPPQRSRLLVGVLAGLVAGLLIFGAGGFFAGRATAPTAAAPSTAPAPRGSLGVFEQNQVAVNQPDFAGSGLTALAEGWLPYLSTCSRSGTAGGPKLNAGEKVRVRCTLDGMSAIFVEYESVAERDKARVKALGQAVDARTLTPGVGAATERATPSGRTTGNYLEYAYRLTESGTTRTVSGIWWDDTQSAVAGYLLAYWKDGLGEKWEPMRDLWSRYA